MTGVSYNTRPFKHIYKPPTIPSLPPRINSPTLTSTMTSATHKQEQDQNAPPNITGGCLCNQTRYTISFPHGSTWPPEVRRTLLFSQSYLPPNPHPTRTLLSPPPHPSPLVTQPTNPPPPHKVTHLPMHTMPQSHRRPHRALPNPPPLPNNLDATHLLAHLGLQTL